MTELTKVKSYETRVVMFISVLGMVRLTVAIVQDLMSGIRWLELLTDIFLFLSFLGLFVFTSKRKNFESISPFFALFYSLLLALNFVHFGSVSGHTKFNYLVGIFLTILFYDPPVLYRLLIFQAALITIICAGALYNPTYFQSLNISKSVSYQDYFGAIIGVAAITAYLKVLTIDEINLYQSLNIQLSTKVQEAQKSKSVLVANSEVLKLAQNELESELDKRTHSLREQNDALERYIQYNTTSLEEPIRKLRSAIDQLPGDSTYSELLKSSQRELDLVLGQINEGLLTRGQINRNEIVGNG